MKPFQFNAKSFENHETLSTKSSRFSITKPIHIHSPVDSHPKLNTATKTNDSFIVCMAICQILFISSPKKLLLSTVSYSNMINKICTFTFPLAKLKLNQAKIILSLKIPKALSAPKRFSADALGEI
jgi:hypothetical protein